MVVIVAEFVPEVVILFVGLDWLLELLQFMPVLDFVSLIDLVAEFEAVIDSAHYWTH